MTAHEEMFKGINFGRFNNGYDLGQAFNKHIPNKDIFFFCIGTDKVKGDSVGPRIGSLLKSNGYTNYLGDMDNPVHAMNLEEKIKLIPVDKVVIAIDAALGRNVGYVSFNKGPCLPGKGVGKELSEVGDYDLNVVIGLEGFGFRPLLTAEESFIKELSEIVMESIKFAFPLEERKVIHA